MSDHDLAIADDKRAMRRALRLARDARLSADESSTLNINSNICDKLLTFIHKDTVVATYRAFGSEADPCIVEHLARGVGAVIAYPRIDSDGAMRFALWQPDVTPPSYYKHIEQPPVDSPVVIPDVVLVPLLAFDAERHRLGQGGGFYDRTLAAMTSCRMIGVAWAMQQVDRVPVQPWDVTLDAVITERQWVGP